MEPVMHSPPASAPAPTTSGTPVIAPDAANSAPLHTHTQSTLAPTSEYVRYLLLALPARYIPRGLIGTLLETNHYRGNILGRVLASASTWFKGTFKHTHAEHASALAYNSIMGVGSLALTTSYSWTVYKDIKNIFSEAVAAETGKSPDQITISDLQNSDNRMVQKTMENFWQRLAKRGLTDLLFFPAAMMRSTGLGDLMIGVKAGQAFSETWKRKTTMFEDLITFVNNKINPRNGLGQSISVGEVFDLYQHYTEAFNPEKMFTNVLERGTGEGALWAQSQPIFQRLTELMNLTYAYKHSSVIDPATGHAIHQADFALPKFIYLLGHDLIDVGQPEKTLATIEIANRYGIGAVKEMQSMLAQGVTLADVNARFPVAPHTAQIEHIEGGKKNAVIAKGSTVQLDRANDNSPSTEVDASSIDATAAATLQASPLAAQIA